MLTRCNGWELWMRWAAVGLAAIALGGCAQVRSVNPDSGIVVGTGSAGLALTKADAFCAQTGRTAHIGSFSVLSSTMTFDCVARTNR